VRRALTWLFALPVIVVGSQVAHGLAYWWAYPQTDVRRAVLYHSGHGYFRYAPMVLAFLAAVEIAAMSAAVVGHLRGRGSRGLPPWAFVLIPLVGFTLQEFLERYCTAGVFPWWTVVEPSFWRGLVLQLPLGLAAYLIARLLLRTAKVVADAVAPRGTTPSFGRSATVVSPGDRLSLPRLAPLAAAAAGRAPPSLACV
jgi:hypothetical protein